MANALANLFTDIADSIRSKTGSTEKLSPSEFASQIDNISVGGGGAEGCVTVTFINGDDVLLTRPVYIGDDCPDPVTQGRIETPTKESTVQYNYTYKGWSEALTNITEDKVVYAAFTQSVRMYTISFYDGDTLDHTEQVSYGGSSTYIPAKKDNQLFTGWVPEPTNVTSDLICYGSWEESFAFADASWEYIAQMSESGNASKVFALGDTKTLQLTTPSGLELETEVQIVGFNHDDLADGTGKAGISLIFVQSFYYALFGFPIYNNASYFNYLTAVSPLLNSSVYECFPEEVQQHIRVVTKNVCTAKESYEPSDEKIWFPATGEITTKTSTSSSHNYNWSKEGSLYEYFTIDENRIKPIVFDNGGTIVDKSSDSNGVGFTTRSIMYRSSGRRSGVEFKTGVAILGDGQYATLGFCI